MTPHQGQPSARLRHKTQTDEFRDFSASINRQRQNNNAQEPRANAPRLSNINRLFNNHQNVVGWPAMPSNLRQEPPANLLPVPTPAPPGPTEPHFVFADEREAYLAKCPPNADFSKIVFMPNARPSGNASNHLQVPITNPAPPPDRLLSPTEEAEIQAVFLAKCRAARRQAKIQRRSQNNADQEPEPEQRNPIPHCDPDDASTPEHYMVCDVCRGIRRRAVPEDHEYWTENKAKVVVAKVKPLPPPPGGEGYMPTRAAMKKGDQHMPEA